MAHSNLNFRRSFSLLTIAAASVAPLVSAYAQDADQPLSEVLVEVTRGDLVESRHYGRLVVVAPDGEIKLSAGNPHELIFPRSALKPMQALATVTLAQQQGIELSTREIAIMCASHEGHEYHLEAASLLLKRAGAAETDLYCGAVDGNRVSHNCSGKHGGMLLQAHLAGDSLAGYWEIDHPVQRRIQKAIAEFADYDQPLHYGIDGCGVPNYAIPLYNLALAYARFANPEFAPGEYRAAAAAIRQAMQAHPELISSRDSFDADLMESAAGRLLGKTGAEACYGMGLSEPQVGVAVKIEDGDPRGMPSVLLYTLDQLHGMTPAMEQAVGDRRINNLTNSVGKTIGQIRPADWAQSDRD